MSRIKRVEVTQPIVIHSGGASNEVLFSFRFLHEVSFNNKKVDRQFHTEFIIRLKKLSELGWKSIRIDKKHGYGYEKIPVSQIKPTISATPTPDANYLFAFRANGAKNVFLGVQVGNVFYILFIEANFGDVYNH